MAQQRTCLQSGLPAQLRGPHTQAGHSGSGHHCQGEQQLATDVICLKQPLHCCLVIHSLGLFQVSHLELRPVSIVLSLSYAHTVNTLYALADCHTHTQRAW